MPSVGRDAAAFRSFAIPPGNGRGGNNLVNAVLKVSGNRGKLKSIGKRSEVAWARTVPGNRKP